MSESLAIGDLRFELVRSARRKTVGITIERDGRLLLTAPHDCPVDELRAIASAKRLWIYTRLAEKELLLRPMRAKEFVSGEGFYYLGQSYRLLLFDPPASEEGPAIRLHHGRFLLRRDERERAAQHLIDWYTRHGEPWIRRRIALFADRIGAAPRSVAMRDLGFRWGSCSPRGSLHFHWRAILFPPRIVEYIAVHELVHLLEPHHTAAFWQRLARALPDLEERKQWLAENGASYY